MLHMSVWSECRVNASRASSAKSLKGDSSRRKRSARRLNLFRLKESSEARMLIHPRSRRERPQSKYTRKPCLKHPWAPRKLILSRVQRSLRVLRWWKLSMSKEAQNSRTQNPVSTSSAPWSERRRSTSVATSFRATHDRAHSLHLTSWKVVIDLLPLFTNLHCLWKHWNGIITRQKPNV